MRNKINRLRYKDTKFKNRNDCGLSVVLLFLGGRYHT